MCLLIVASRLRPDLPLVVAANRDEWLERPAVPMEVLRARAPRTLGGRDLMAGGSWMAVNRRGVVAALTNRPGGRDGARRSRGEIPLRLSAHATAGEAAAAFARESHSEDYNPAWVLVGDRERLFYLEVAAGTPLVARELPPGLHILENRPLDAPSPKVDWVRRALPHIAAAEATGLPEALACVLRSHDVPPGVQPEPLGNGGPLRPLETYAACVHAGAYGTRSSMIVLIPKSRRGSPDVRFTRGSPCTSPFESANELW
ncbi:MAG TPA: NRDE family protein [Myxococcales bacterium]|nr:NRDE family protein [Myxococcales bacterium]